MNLKLLLPSFLSIAILHFFVFTYAYEQNTLIPEKKTTYKKVNLQYVQIKEVQPIKEPIIKSIDKPEIKKEIFEKPIKKEAIRKIVKKKKKKIIKKRIKKKIVKKRVKKKKVIEKIPKEPIKNETLEVNKKEIKKTVNKTPTISLKKIKLAYLRQLRIQIDKNKKYPKISKRLNEQGKVLISFRILKSGLITNIKLLTSSGKKRLDKAALNAIYKTVKFKEFGKQINKEFMDITLPIQFRLT